MRNNTSQKPWTRVHLHLCLLYAYIKNGFFWLLLLLYYQYDLNPWLKGLTSSFSLSAPGRGQTLSPHLCKMQPMSQNVHRRWRNVSARSVWVTHGEDTVVLSAYIQTQTCLHRIDSLASALQRQQQSRGQLQGRSSQYPHTHTHTVIARQWWILHSNVLKLTKYLL